jgi:hypothetical protein
MRFLRFTFLQSYFLTINKNKKKALTLINTGIFFTVFAITAALISFSIETKISKKESELIQLQISILETGREVAEIETWLSIYESGHNENQSSRVFSQFFSNTKLGGRTISQKDYFAPSIYYSLIEIKELSDPEFNVFDNNDPFYKEIIETLTGVWDEEDIDKFKKAVFNFTESYKKIEKLDFNDFKNNKIPSLDEILNEILNYSENNLNSVNDKLSDYDFAIDTFNLRAIQWGKQLMKVFKAMHAYERDYMNEVNKEIISYSKNEKNIILITFIFQFFIFLIIQFFEVNSFNSNIKKIIK